MRDEEKKKMRIITSGAILVAYKRAGGGALHLSRAVRGKREKRVREKRKLARRRKEERGRRKKGKWVKVFL